MMKSYEVRKRFMDFFRSKDHQIVPSAPMVVKNDPTLMFTNAGMNQFKDIFLGNKPAPHPRVADTQKCLRVSGKHNDLEEVGHDTYHHTMFEMLGNWSFGDYFKKEAIEWAWELLTEEYGINKENLYVTVFEGAESDGLEPDNEAYNHWRNIIPEERILYGPKKDNFWEMGDTGPCGPCSEIHIDIRPEEEKKKKPGKELVNQDHPFVIEIWNLVFIQFNRQADGSLLNLPQKHIDTGMGFERLTMVLQNKSSNYETDIFQPFIEELSDMTGKKYDESHDVMVAMRVIADHVRAISFAIADGQLPSNIKAGYVIRRILRRAVRYGYTFLGLREPFINKLVPILVQQMSDFFPELKSQQQLIEKVINEEEQSFLRTLETGIHMLDQIIQRAKSKGEDTISGKDAFILYDTYGFPYDLTQLILKENDLKLDKAGFDKEMEAQKSRSRNASAQEAGDWVVLSKQGQGEFIGYDTLDAEIHITRYRKVKTKKKELYHLVFDQTPFYAEAGGQVGDKGYIRNENEKIAIVDTKKENDLTIHIAEKLPEKPEAAFKGVVNETKRFLTANNHSATHLLHFAMREILGQHVEQKGSLVHPDYLRFDFSHFQKVTDEEVRKIERLVNQKIRQNLPLVEKRSVPIKEALDMGAMSLFGEKYGDKVRVVQFGDSVELCGGTHVTATGQIGIFKIVSESAIAAGVRRIEAITADKAEEYFYLQIDTLEEIKHIVKNPKDPVKGAINLAEQNTKLQKQIEELNQEKIKQLIRDLSEDVEAINGINFIGKKVNLDPATIKDLAFKMKGTVNDLFLIIGGEKDGKANLTIMIADNLVKEKGYHAGHMIRDLAREINGGGGGQPHFASAGGKDPNGIENALEKARQMLL
ncbi:MAG: alanine--tRNA ligase [Bacteroidales bacterium]|nr:alanine--tRNA ligase [Bacteroidales bacterium]